MVKSASEEDQIDYKKLLTQCTTAVISHPLTQCRVLIQLGHEPVDPIYRQSKFLVSDGYYYNGFLTGYINDAKLCTSKEAVLCGLVYKLLETSSSSVTQTLVKKPISRLPFPETKGGYEEVLLKSTKEFLTKAAGVIISRPFTVILVRQIASLANEGKIDTRIIEPFIDTVRKGELFAGLVPKLIYEMSIIFGSNTLVHLYNELKSDDMDETVDKVFPSLINMAVSVLSYPLHLVSTVACVQGSGLSLDAFPELHWLELLSKLRSANLHKRGNSIIFNRKIPKVPEAFVESRV